MASFLKNFKAISASSLTLTLLLVGMLKTVNAETRLVILNPGFDGYPREWTAGTPRDVGTSMFIFYSNETDVGDTFFLNVTVQNVERLIGWGIGLIFDKTLLSYVSAWFPKDHVFQHVNETGWELVFPPDPYVGDLNATHGTVRWGCIYAPENEIWSFNGTGTLCQIQFKIIKEISAESWFAFDHDPKWTALYVYDPNEPDDGYRKLEPGDDLELGDACFKYFGSIVEPQQSPEDLYLKIIVVIVILAAALASFFLLLRRSKFKPKKRG